MFLFFLKGRDGEKGVTGVMCGILGHPAVSWSLNQNSVVKVILGARLKFLLEKQLVTEFRYLLCFTECTTGNCLKLSIVYPAKIILHSVPHLRKSFLLERKPQKALLKCRGDFVLGVFRRGILP